MEPVMRLQQALGRKVEELHLQGQHDQKSHGGGGVAGRVVEAVEESEGGSLERATGEKVKTGYMVGLGTVHGGSETQVPVAKFDKEDVRNWLRRKAVREAFKSPKAKIGVWVDNGMVVIEPSEQFTDRDRAIVAGRFRNQQGIYHIDNDEYISTGGTGK